MKKFFTLKNILLCVAAVLGLVAVLMMFAPALSGGKNSDAAISGFKVAFGYSEKTVLGDAKVLNFSFMYFLAFLLALVGIVFAVLAFLGKLGKISAIVAAACFLVAGILFFCAVPLCNPNFESKELVKAFKENVSLGAGAIVGGIFSIISALAACATLFVDKLTK